MAAEKKSIFFPEQEEFFKERTGKEFSFFYQKYYPKLLYYTSKMCQSARLDPSKAEDVSTDAFLVAFEKIDKYEKEKSQFSTWLFTIARNTVIDWSRKKKSFVFSDFEDGEGNNVLVDTLADLEPLPDEIFRRAEDEKFFDDLLAKLSPASREVLLLHYRESLTFDEIAGVVGKSLNTVKSQHRRALEILRKMM